MIVVVGELLYRATDDGEGADGMAARIGIAAASAGRVVQLVGKTGEDPEGDALLLALARGGVGHVAVLRDAGMRTPVAVQPVELGDAAVQEVTGENPTQAVVGEATDGRSGLDAGDIDLALRYLTNFSVVVLADGSDSEIARVVTSAADWADARLVVVVPAGGAIPDGLPPNAIVFESPEADPDGVFAGMVGSFAAALDDGSEPADAFKATVEDAGWVPAPAE